METVTYTQKRNAKIASFNFHGTINDAYEIGCEMERKRVECSIMIKAALADNEKEVY